MGLTAQITLRELIQTMRVALARYFLNHNASSGTSRLLFTATKKPLITMRNLRRSLQTCYCKTRKNSSYNINDSEKNVIQSRNFLMKMAMPRIFAMWLSVFWLSVFWLSVSRAFHSCMVFVKFISKGVYLSIIY